jgi:hypothetical protein
MIIWIRPSGSEIEVPSGFSAKTAKSLGWKKKKADKPIEPEQPEQPEQSGSLL